MKEDDDSEDDDEFDKDKLSHKPSAILNQDWQRIHDAISEVSEDQDLAKLTHPALNIFVFKRRADGEVITRYVPTYAQCSKIREKCNPFSLGTCAKGVQFYCPSCTYPISSNSLLHYFYLFRAM